ILAIEVNRLTAFQEGLDLFLAESFCVLHLNLHPVADCLASSHFQDHLVLESTPVSGSSCIGQFWALLAWFHGPKIWCMSKGGFLSAAGPPSLWPPRGGAHAGGRGARRPADGKPDLNGIWQALSTAASDLEDHNGALHAPAGQSVVDSGEIPYQASALAK